MFVPVSSKYKNFGLWGFLVFKSVSVSGGWEERISPSQVSSPVSECSGRMLLFSIDHIPHVLLLICGYTKVDLVC